MKKVSIFMAIAAAASLASCTAQSPKANLKTDLDSLSYSIGMAQTQGLKGYLTGRLDVDTAYMADFIKGLNEGANKTSKKDIAYMAGLQIGQQISNQMMKGINQELFAGDSTKTISKDNFMAGFIAGTLEKGGMMTMDEAQTYTRTAMETIKAKALEEKYADYKAENEKFLDENKTKEGVKTSPRGVQYKVINNYRKVVRDQTFVDQTDNLYHINLPQDSAYESTESAYDLKEMRRVVNALPKEYRVPFAMHVAGFKYREIADKLNLPLGTVKSRIFFTRQKLQEELKDFR